MCFQTQPDGEHSGVSSGHSQHVERLLAPLHHGQRKGCGTRLRYDVADHRHQALVIG